MVLMAIVGELGMGKTLTLSYIGWENWFYRGRKIYANYTLYGIPFTPIKTLADLKKMIPAETPTLEQLMESKEIIFLGDELWKWCIHPKTFVFTHKNVVRADNSFFSNPFLSVDTNLRINEGIATQLFKKILLPSEKLVKISTRTKEITVSKDHVFFTINRDPNFFCRHKGIKDIRKFIKEKRASEIRKYDRVLTLFRAKEPKNELIDKKTSQLIGYIFADGHINYPQRNTIHIDDCSFECLEKYKKIAEDIGFKTSIKKHKGKNLYRLMLTGKDKVLEIVENVKDSLELSNFKYSSFFFKDIPRKIVESNNRVLGAFLRGFFDGEACVKIDKTYKKFVKILVVQKRKEILEKIKYLLLRFGISSSNIKKKFDKKGNEFYSLIISDSLSLRLFRKHIGFSHPDKKVKLRLIKKFKSKSKRRVFGDVEVEMVTRVEEVEPDCSYLVDFSIPYFSNYVANGFIVHNCDSRLSVLDMSKKERTKMRNKIVADILGASRKAFVTIVYTTQTISQVDKRIREVTDFTVYPMTKGDMIHAPVFMGVSVKAPAIEKVIRFIKEPFYAIFNTYERVQYLEEGNENEPLKEIVIPIEENPAWIYYLKKFKGMSDEEIEKECKSVKKMLCLTV